VSKPVFLSTCSKTRTLHGFPESRPRGSRRGGCLLFCRSLRERRCSRELGTAGEIRVEERANDTYGAFKVGTHDDLVTALGLAVQGDRPKVGVTQSNYRGTIVPPR
jgi:hypothetical protein